ncbi:MAG: bifunctional D-glycero-beta-D-manno-heptose-7-phosphate kinase/D-glycero-beta-D-manno-heptose 1-phosphate adenylyltransferase HldE, partial [Halofilum sp. (in: g-proteobacteria)]
DRYWSGETGRISPEAPVPVVGLRDFRDRPGGAANVALNVAALGSQATLLGRTGRDEAGDTLRAALDSTGVTHELLDSNESPTITKLRIVSRNQHLMRLDIEDGFAAADPRALLEAFRKRVGQADVAVLSDYAKGTLAGAVPELIALAREAGCRVLVDPKGDDFAAYRGADLVTPNRGEFERIAGRCPDDATLERRARELIDTHDLGGLLITRSQEGMTLVPRGGDAVHLPAHRREVYDVTGAGDTVIGVLAAALAAGQPLVDAMVLANHAAGIVVGRLGAAQVSLAELRAAMEGTARGHAGVVDAETLVEQVAAARAAGESVVFTNGCFDLLHAGHLESLRDMRAHGDRLVVAVNDDASVARLKGPERPIVPLAQRMALLAALDCVDWVAPFAEDTPAALIERVRPDVLAKGGDYAPEEIAGYDTVTGYGGRVQVVDYRAGWSTSDLIARIRDRG